MNRDLPVSLPHDGKSDANDLPVLESAPAAVRYDVQLRTELNPPDAPADLAYAATLRRLHDVLRQVRRPPNAENLSDAGSGKSHQTDTTDCSPAMGAAALREVRESLPVRFSVHRLLGQGSFGRVFLARDGLLHRDVAVKFPHRSALDHPELKSRFLRESRAVARLSHPNIVPVLDSGESNGVSWQVAEFVPGPSLSEFRRQQQSRLSAREAASLLMQLADAVQHAHEHGVLHRDIKPENILLAPLPQSSDGAASLPSAARQRAGDIQSMTPRLTDFGLARLVDEEVGISQSGVLIGTPKYMAPEQLSGRSSAQGPWTDVYSLGVLLHELLTGVVPFAEANSVQTRASVMARPVPGLRRLNRDIPRDMETICLKCLSARPEDRYRSAAELRDDLRRFLEGRSTLARPLPLHEQFLRWAGRNRFLAMLLLMLLVSVTVVFAQIVSSHRATQEQNHNLAMALSQLTEEKKRADSMVTLAESHRENAEQNEFRFRELAWNSSFRETFQAMGQNRFHAAWEILQTLQSSHPGATSRSEWQLASQELASRYNVIFDATYPLNAVAAVPGTGLVAVAGESHDVDIIDTLTYRRVRSITTDIHSIHALAVTRDGKRIAVGGRTNKKAVDEALPSIFSLETGELLQTLSGHPTTIDAMVFSHDGTRLIVGSRYEPVRIYDLVQGSESVLQTVRKNDWLAVTEDGTEVMALASNNTVVIAPLDRPSEPRLIKANSELSLVVQLPGTRIMACTEYQNWAVHLIHMDTGVQVGRLVLTGKSSSFLSVSTTQPRLFVGRVDGNVAMFDIPKDWLDPPTVENDDAEKSLIPEMVASEVVTLDSETLTDSAFADGVLYCCSKSGRLMSYEFPGTRQAPFRRATETGPWRSVVISHTGGIFLGDIYGSVFQIPGSVREGQTQDRRLVEQVRNGGPAEKVWKDGPGPFLRLAVSPELTKMVVATDRRQLYLKSTMPNEPTVCLLPEDPAGEDIFEVSFSPDGRWLAWTGSDDILHTVSVSNPTEIRRTALPSNGLSVQYSPDSRLLACSGTMAEMVVYDSVTMEVVQTLKDCYECVSIEWVPSEDTLLLGFVDGYIQVRSLRDEGLLQKKMIHQQDVAGIVILPNSELAVSVDRTAQVAVWNRRTLALVGFLFEPPGRPDIVPPMSPALRIVDSGELILVYDDAAEGPQIVRWNLKDFENYGADDSEDAPHSGTVQGQQ